MNQTDEYCLLKMFKCIFLNLNEEEKKDAVYLSSTLCNELIVL